MASIIAVTIYQGLSRPWSGGRVKRRYLVSLSDVSNIAYTIVLGPFIVPADDDGMAQAAAHLDMLKSAEVETYKAAVREGVNPFVSYQARWNTRPELLQPILADALTLPATEPLVLNGLPYLSQVSDVELIALFGRDQNWVDDVRAQAAALLAGRDVLVNYTPVGI